MSSRSSKKFHLTLPWDEGSEVEAIAATRGVPATQILRERLSEWKQYQSHTLRPPQTSHTTDVDLAPLHQQLERLEHQSATTQTLIQHILNEDIPDSPGIDLSRFLLRMERLETIMDGMYVLLERIALDTTSAPQESLALIQEIQTKLAQYLKENT